MADRPDLMALIDRVRTGSADALEMLYRACAADVHRTAFRILRSRADAEDVVQEVFLGAGCGRCQGTLRSIRSLDAAAEALPTPPLTDEVLQRLLARSAAGEDVLLPCDESPVSAPASVARAARSRQPGRAAAAAVLTVAGAGLTVFLSTRGLKADASELRLVPERPGRGASIRVEYHATSRLGGEPALVLRARLRRPNDAESAETRAVATLRRERGGVFRGSFPLPDSVVYAVFAVEDPAARDVDYNGETWEMLVRGRDGRPELDALDQRYADVRLRNGALARETVEEIRRVYPRSVRGLLFGVLADREAAPSAKRDSVSAAYRGRLAAALAGGRTARLADPRAMADVVFAATYMADTATARVWRDRLIRAHPTSEAAFQQRVFGAFDAHRDDATALFAELERMWRGPGGAASRQLAFSGFTRARLARDPVLVRRWGERFVRADSSFLPGIIAAEAELPELRDAMMAHIRVYLRRLEADPGASRSLTQTADEHEAAARRVQGHLLAQLGSALVTAGDTRAGLDTLSLAVDRAWSPQLFRTTAATRLGVGDTAGALPLLARVAADPTTSPAFIDSVRARFGSRYTPAQWAEWTTQADSQMRADIFELAVHRAVKGEMRLTDRGGNARVLDPAGGDVTFVAFWYRECAFSLMQMPELQATTRELERRGVRVVTIPGERASPALDAYIAKQKLEMPILYDPDARVRRAFGAPGWPTYVVLDARGEIRFEERTLDDVIRQVELLRREHRPTS